MVRGDLPAQGIRHQGSLVGTLAQLRQPRCVPGTASGQRRHRLLAGQRSYQVAARKILHQAHLVHLANQGLKPIAHAIELLHKQLSPALANERVRHKMHARRLKHRLQVHQRHLFAIRPLAPARLLHPPHPVPVTGPVRYQHHHILVAAAGHAAHKAHLLLKRIVLQHPGVKHHVCARLGNGKGICLNGVHRHVLLRKQPAGIVQRLRRKVQQAHRIAAIARQAQALRPPATARLQHTGTLG